MVIKGTALNLALFLGSWYLVTVPEAPLTLLSALALLLNDLGGVKVSPNIGFGFTRFELLGNN